MFSYATNLRFTYIFHESLPGLQGHLSKERPRAFSHFFRRQVFENSTGVPIWTGSSTYLRYPVGGSATEDLGSGYCGHTLA